MGFLSKTLLGFLLGNLLHGQFRPLLGFAGNISPYGALSPPSPPPPPVDYCRRTWRRSWHPSFLSWFYVSVQISDTPCPFSPVIRSFFPPSFFSDLSCFEDVVFFMITIYCSDPYLLTLTQFFLVVCRWWITLALPLLNTLLSNTS